MRLFFQTLVLLLLHVVSVDGKSLEPQLQELLMIKHQREKEAEKREAAAAALLYQRHRDKLLAEAELAKAEAAKAAAAEHKRMEALSIAHAKAIFRRKQLKQREEANKFDNTETNTALFAKWMPALDQTEEKELAGLGVSYRLNEALTLFEDVSAEAICDSVIATTSRSEAATKLSAQVRDIMHISQDYHVIDSCFTHTLDFSPVDIGARKPRYRQQISGLNDDLKFAS